MRKVIVAGVDLDKLEAVRGRLSELANRYKMKAEKLRRNAETFGYRALRNEIEKYLSLAHSRLGYADVVRDAIEALERLGENEKGA